MQGHPHLDRRQDPKVGVWLHVLDTCGEGVENIVLQHFRSDWYFLGRPDGTQGLTGLVALEECMAVSRDSLPQKSCPEMLYFSHGVASSAHSTSSLPSWRSRVSDHTDRSTFWSLYHLVSCLYLTGHKDFYVCLMHVYACKPTLLCGQTHASRTVCAHTHAHMQKCTQVHASSKLVLVLAASGSWWSQDRSHCFHKLVAPPSGDIINNLVLYSDQSKVIVSWYLFIDHNLNPCT